MIRGRPLRLPGPLLLTPQDYVEHYQAEGERLLRSGVEPSVAASAYLQAFPRLLSYLRHHGDALGERGVVSGELQAGQILVDRVAISAAPATAPAAPGGPTVSSAGGEADATPGAGVIAAAAGKLGQVRDSVRRLTRGPAGEALRHQLGLGYRVEPCSAASVTRGIDLMLSGLSGDPDLLHQFRLIPRDVEQLAEHRERLRGLLGGQGVTPPLQGEAREARRDHLAVEAFFASVAAAISVAFAERDPRRIAGLKLIPRNDERRSKSRPQPRLWRAPLPSIDE